MGTIKPFLIQTNYPPATGTLPSNNLSKMSVQHFHQLPPGQPAPHPLSLALSPLSHHDEVLSQMNHHPATAPAHFRLFPSPAVKTPRFHTDSTTLDAVDKITSKLPLLAPDANGPVRSSEPNRFITTPLPSYGPSSGYGYTTTNSFVNVQFGGNTHVTAAASPHISQSVVGPTNKFEGTLPAVTPENVNKKHSWNEISQYYLNNQKPISRPNHSLMSLDSHIKQTTVGPVNLSQQAAFLPPHTPIINKNPSKSFNNNKKFSFPKPPSLRFESDYLPVKNHPVTLPPFINNIVEDPLFVRLVYF